MGLRQMTTESREDVADRAVSVVLGIMDARGLRALPALRGDFLLWLCSSAGRESAVRSVEAQFGYVPSDPVGFLALQAES